MYTAKKIRRLLLVIIPMVAVVVAAASTTGLVNWWKIEEEEAPAEVSDREDPAQKALINELMAWLQPFDSTNTSYYVNGLLTAIDRTDSAHALTNVPYTLCKSGNDLYLRMGQTETVNDASHYCFVDHGARKMLLGKARDVVFQSGLPGRELYKYIRGEGYTFTKTRNNSGLWTISMKNPNHISRKEFSVQYDSTFKQVKEIFIRQAEVTDPMNSDKEKWITLVINDWNDNPDAGKYINVRRFIQKKQDAWVCAPAFREYDLITQ